MCSKFFRPTLNLGERTIQIALSKFNSNTMTTDAGQRSGTVSSKKLSNVALQLVMDHINLFPRMQSHYCRKSSSKEYLEIHLSIPKMYELYVKWAEAKCVAVGDRVKQSMYKHIFVTR